MPTIKAQTTEKKSPVPAGDHWGAYASGSGWNGRQLVRDTDGVSIVVQADPQFPSILDANELDSAFDVPVAGLEDGQ